MDNHKRTGSYICVFRYKRLVFNLKCWNVLRQGRPRQGQGEKNNHFLLHRNLASIHIYLVCL